MIDTESTRKAYSVQEVAQATGLSKQTVYAEIRAGTLKAKRVRSRIIVLAADVDEWLTQR